MFTLNTVHIYLSIVHAGNKQEDTGDRETKNDYTSSDSKANVRTVLHSPLN